MSNKYLKTIRVKRGSANTGTYDAWKGIGTWARNTVSKPEIKAGYRWHYAKQAASKMKSIRTPSKPGRFSKIIDAFTVSTSKDGRGTKVNPWTQFSIAPTSVKSLAYQTSIMLHGMRMYFVDERLKSLANMFYNFGEGQGNRDDFKKIDSQDPADIQKAARSAYRKVAKKLGDLGNYDSSDPKVQFFLNHIKGYSKLSEIAFAKELSMEANPKFSKKAQEQKKKEYQKKIKKAKKDNKLSSASKGYPIKSKSEGNAFRNWVNDNRPKWAKKNSLDRSGNHDNSYIRKAWKTFGKDYLEAMAHQAFLETKTEMPTKTKTEIKIEQISLSPTSFDTSIDPFSEPPQEGMMELLENDPEEFLKQYWYIPTGFFVGIISLATIIGLATGGKE